MYVAKFFETHGVLHACISPGARNSPLTYAFTTNKNIQCYSHIDERSAAFFGLGLAKDTKKPVVILSTSGTAVANYFPAVIEANFGRVPIIILSSDRPAHLINTGANQTINQKELYGNNVRYFKDVGLPSENVESLGAILEEGMVHVIGKQYKLPAGPIHFNFPFDEPLFPSLIEDSKFSFSVLKEHTNIEDNISIIDKAINPLIVMGPMENNSYQEDILQLAEIIEAPILADPLSQMRYGYTNEQIITHYDHFIHSLDSMPDLIVRFGRKPTSKKLCKLLDDNASITYLVDNWIQYNDDCANFIFAPIDTFCQKQVADIQWRGSKEWKKLFVNLEQKIEQCIISYAEFFEGTIARTCHQLLEEGDQFIIGNSMPIRDVDMFTSKSDVHIDTYANRGASGVDGVISTALGVAANNKRTLLLIGDVSFYHDMNGLLASKYVQNVTIVIINNNGGGIFSFLPIAESNINTFHEYWTTDTDLDFQKVAELYKYNYRKASNLLEVNKYVQASLQQEGLQIVEVQVTIDDNVHAHKNFQQKVESLLQEP